MTRRGIGIVSFAVLLTTQASAQYPATFEGRVSQSLIVDAATVRAAAHAIARGPTGAITYEYEINATINIQQNIPTVTFTTSQTGRGEYLGELGTGRLGSLLLLLLSRYDLVEIPR